jgi:hypothetical protein
MTDMTVDVSITSTSPLTATYKSSTSGVSSDGDIQVEQGETANITFSPAPDSPIQGWSFQSPWVAIAAIPPAPTPPPGPVAGPSQGATAVVVVDDDENKSGEDQDYEYTLYTTLGQLDPRIINKSGSG